MIKAFIAKKSDKIELFWSISGDFNPKTLWLTITHILIPISLIFYGFFVIISKFESRPVIYSVVDFVFNNLPILKTSVAYVALWGIYFLLALLVCISSFRIASPQLGRLNSEFQSSYLKKISDLFTPIETTIIVALKISEELHRYATVKIPSDLGLRGDLDFIVGKYYNRLIDRPLFSTYGSRLITNSFFVDLRNEQDIRDRLDLDAWYGKEPARKDGIYDNLFEVREMLYKKAVFGDYQKGSVIFSKIAETFVLAYNKEKDNFRKSLEELITIVKEYEKSREPIRGLPLMVLNAAKWLVKKKFYFINFILATIVAIGFFYILPLCLFEFLRAKLQNPPSVDLIRNIFFGIVAIYAILLQKN